MGVNDLQVQTVPDPRIVNPHDAILKVRLTTTCGSDLHLLGGYIPTMREGDVIGHEYMGEVVEVGPETTRLKVGDRVVVPSFLGCSKCWYCEHDYWSLCDNTHPKPELSEPLLGYPAGGIPGYSHDRRADRADPRGGRAAGPRQRRPRRLDNGRAAMIDWALEGEDPTLIEPIAPKPDVPFVVEARHSAFYATQLEYLVIKAHRRASPTSGTTTRTVAALYGAPDVTSMWTIIEGPEPVAPLGDHHRFRFVVERTDARRELFVHISGTVAASDVDTLPSPIDEAVRTNGLDTAQRYVDETNRDRTAPPSAIEVNTTGEWLQIAPAFADRSTDPPIGGGWRPRATDRPVA